MMSSTRTNDLSTPLLSNHQRKEDDAKNLECDEEEGCMPRCLKIVYDEELQYSQSSCDQKEYSCSRCDLLLFVLLHSLMLRTFGVALYASPIWLWLNCNIILFVIVAYLYKQTIKDCKPTCSAVVLLPELLQIIILSVMMFDKEFDVALVLMSISSLCLSLLTAVASGEWQAVSGAFNFDQPKSLLDIVLF
jgi:hypothetical protein